MTARLTREERLRIRKTAKKDPKSERPKTPRLEDLINPSSSNPSQSPSRSRNRDVSPTLLERAAFVPRTTPTVRLGVNRDEKQDEKRWMRDYRAGTGTGMGKVKDGFGINGIMKGSGEGGEGVRRKWEGRGAQSKWEGRGSKGSRDRR